MEVGWKKTEVKKNEETQRGKIRRNEKSLTDRQKKERMKAV